MDEFSEVRSELKKWESNFVKSCGRKPSKEDVEVAGEEVISLYKKYDKLKRAQTFSIWGKELNKASSIPSALDPVEEKEEQPTFRMSISKHFSETSKTSITLKIKKPFDEMSSKENEELTSVTVPVPKLCNFKLKSNSSRIGAPPLKRFNSPLLAMQRSGLRNDFLTSLPSIANILDPNSQNSFEPQSTKSEMKENRRGTFLSQNHGISSNMPPSSEITAGNPSSVTTSKSPEMSREILESVKDEKSVATKPSKARSTKRKRKENDADCGGDGDDYPKTKKHRLEEESEEIFDRNTYSAEDAQDVTKGDSSEVTTKWRKPREYSTKMSGDNYVRLNLKVKKYSKRGGISAVAVRKQIWKQKLRLKFGGGEGGKAGSCFKCGQPGHWSKNCKNKGTSSSMKEFDWTMGSQNNQAQLPENVAEIQRVDIGQSATKALEQVSFLGDVIHEKFEQRQCLSSVDPLFELNEDGSVPEIPPQVKAALKKFGYDSFREGQEETIMNILCGKSTLVILSTGSGKSLCYQLPAFIYAQRSSSLCLVISPLVSLMQDQVLDLPACLKGACIHNNMTVEQRQKVLESAADNQLHFLLLSPEMLVGGLFSGEGRAPNLPPISFACIDEVHCLSDWSHHFRPSYLMICKVLRERFGVKCFLGLTATANISTIESVCQHFNIDANDQSSIIRQAPVPRNLMVTISRDEDKEEMLIQLLKGGRFSRCQSVIVYCTRREQTARIATLIRTRMQHEALDDDDGDDDGNNDAGKDGGDMKAVKGKARKPKKRKPKAPLKWDAECYHAGLTAVQRKRIQKNFMSGKLRVVVATVAFGMGLDKSDVRGVIHFNIPGTVESYIQEIGRAGRDGILSHCHLFLDATASDLMELKRHIHAKSLDQFTVKKLVQQVFKPCRCRYLHEFANEASNIDQEESMSKENPTDNLSGNQRICPGHERSLSIETLVKSLDVKEEGLSTLLCYLELCPQRWINNRHPVYSRCTIKFYSAQNEFSHLLKRCPALGVLLAQRKDLVTSLSSSRSIDFDVIKLSDCMGIQSGQIKKQLKDLQFISDENGCRRSGVVVEFSDLSFHFQAPGDLLDEEIDQVVDDLYKRVHSQECAELYHLKKFYEMSSDHRLNGRSIARVFHGIHSPCFPSETWSKVRRYWRSHMDVDFNELRRIATLELAS